MANSLEYHDHLALRLKLFENQRLALSPEKSFGAYSLVRLLGFKRTHTQLELIAPQQRQMSKNTKKIGYLPCHAGGDGQSGCQRARQWTACVGK